MEKVIQLNLDMRLLLLQVQASIESLEAQRKFAILGYVAGLGLPIDGKIEVNESNTELKVTVHLNETIAN